MIRKVWIEVDVNDDDLDDKAVENVIRTLLAQDGGLRLIGLIDPELAVLVGNPIDGLSVVTGFDSQMAITKWSEGLSASDIDWWLISAELREW